MHSVALVLASLPIAALARGHGASNAFAHRREHKNLAARGSTWTLADHHQGPSFFDGWDFFTGADPTNGNVNFLSQDKAMSGDKPLAYVQKDNTTIMAVDDTTWLGDGQNRNSVRISSKKTYNSGLFIADFWSMPHGCSVWPAWWSAGSEWPANGEIDVVEGVNEGTTNQYTLHTGQACQLSANKGAGNSLFNGNVLGTTCLSSNGANAGCAISDSRNTSFGHGFNMIGGGVFAHQWTSAGIKMWFFERSEIPGDVYSQQPNPDSWPTPVANFDLSDCDVASAFKDHSLTFDITVCGGWAGAAYGQNGQCPGTCTDAVKDPNNFKYAKWEINYVSVYQQS